MKALKFLKINRNFAENKYPKSKVLGEPFMSKRECIQQFQKK